MKTTLLNPEGVRFPSLLPMSLAVLAMMPATASGEFKANDPLSGNNGNWNTSITGGTSLVFQNSRLEALIKSPAKNDYAFLTWTRNSGTYQENWFIQVDVRLDMIPLPPGAGVVVGLGAMNLNDTSKITYIGLAREQNDGFNNAMFVVTECMHQKPHHTVVTTATKATLRLHFDRAHKTLTGSWNTGSGWRYAPPLGIKEWGMDDPDEFCALLMAGNFGATNKGVKVVSGDACLTRFVAGVTSPDIAVEQPAGSSLTDEKSTRRFGAISVHGQGRSKTFIIRNEGTAKLRNLKLTRNGSHATDFTIAQPTGTSLKPGAATNFVVTFAPKAAGTRSAGIHISSNDPDESPFDFSVSGVGVK